MISSKIGSTEATNPALRENKNPNTERVSALAVGSFYRSASRLELSRLSRGANGISAGLFAINVHYEKLTYDETGISPDRVKEFLQKELGNENEIFTMLKANIKMLDFEYKKRGKMEFSPLLPNGHWSHLTLRLNNGLHGKTIPIGDNTPCNRIVIDVPSQTLRVFGSLSEVRRIVEICPASPLSWK
jgi:hypothetical protein